jgi:23S rRNA (uridine2552-2'-O)-methyltransferase
MAPLRGVTLVQGDFRTDAALSLLEQALAGRQVDLVLSDMSPNISGISMSDQARVMGLAELALEFAGLYLKPGGNLLVKVFQGAGFQEFFRTMRDRFQSLVTRKPAASRDRSNELYLLGKDKLHYSLLAVHGRGEARACQLGRGRRTYRALAIERQP